MGVPAPAGTPFRQVAVERGRVERRGEQVALAGVAAEVAQVRELGLVLDALRNGPQPEAAAELDERLDQRVRLARARCPNRTARR